MLGACLVAIVTLASVTVGSAASLGIASTHLGTFGGPCTQPVPPPPPLLQPYTIPCH